MAVNHSIGIGKSSLCRVFMGVAACLHTTAPLRAAECDGRVMTGVASYYGSRFHGRTTANGETFNMNAMTAAHKSLPFGTRVEVSIPGEDGAVIVRINDRGPFVEGRSIDLSRAAATQLGFRQDGVTRVRMQLCNG